MDTPGAQVYRNKTRILVHDRSGHAFPVQLSRALAQRGHDVLHSYASFFQTPKGNLVVHPDDPPTLRIEAIDLDKPFQKYSFIKRYFQELKFGQLLVAQIKAYNPDVILLGQIPPEAQTVLYRRLPRTIRKVFWVQDLYGIAIKKILGKKLSFLGKLIGDYYIFLERRLLRQSDALVLITADFIPLMHQWGIADDHIHVIPNWAVLPDVPVRSKDNPWAQAHDLVDKVVFAYSGTLGMKHNPDILLRLAQKFKDAPQVRVLVVSQGLGADYLRDKKDELGLDNLLLEPFQPFDVLPDVLGSADVLIAVLEPDAGVFSVPSKILSYFCAQRPMLLAVPLENLAARTVVAQQAGLAVAPDDLDAFIAAAETLYADAALRRQMGFQGRAHAESTFKIEIICDLFERVLCNE